MLSDTALKNLHPKATLYKVTDRDGIYVTISPVSTVTFRYDYRVTGRRETLTSGRYGSDGLSLARARERCIDARRAVPDGKSPAQEKQHEKRRLSEAKTFQEFTDRWAKEARMADSTRSMRESILDRDILPAFKSRLLTEITSDNLRDLCNKVKANRAHPTTEHFWPLLVAAAASMLLATVIEGGIARGVLSMDAFLFGAAGQPGTEMPRFITPENACPALV